jgi:hypothetical protein
MTEFYLYYSETYYNLTNKGIDYYYKIDNREPIKVSYASLTPIKIKYSDTNLLGIGTYSHSKSNSKLEGICDQITSFSKNKNS